MAKINNLTGIPKIVLHNGDTITLAELALEIQKIVGNGNLLFIDKGDLAVGIGIALAERLVVGVDGTFLKADSAEVTGLSWDSPSGSGDVQGAPSSLDNEIVLFNSTSGKVIKTSNKTIAQIFADHVGLADPHSQYALDSDLAAHAAAADPHTLYLLEADAASIYQALDALLTSISSLAFATNSLKVLRVNAGETAFELVDEIDISGKQDLDALLTSISALAFAGNGEKVLSVNVAENAFELVDQTGGGGSGDVVGPASSVNNRVVLFDGVTGKLLKDSGLLLSGSNTGDQDLSGKQDLDALLTSISALAFSSNSLKVLRVNAGETAFELVTISTGGGDLLAANNLSDLVNDSTARTNLGLGSVDNTSDADKPISTATQTALDGKQPIDTQLTDLAALTYASNGLKVVRVNAGATGWELATISTGGGDLLASNNLSDLLNSATARNNLGLGAIALLATIIESSITLADNTTNDATDARHGFLKKLSNNAAHYMDGLGNWTTPPDNDTTVNETITLSGDATGSGTNAITVAIGNDKILTAMILNSNVTLAKIANIATARFLGRITAASGVVEELTAANAKTILALVKGDVGLSNVDNTTDANKPISTATQTALDGKQNLDAQLTDLAALAYASNGLKVLRVNAGETGWELATISAGGGDMLASNNLSDVLSAATARTNLGLAALAELATVSDTEIDANAVTTVKILNANVTLAKIANIATARLLGRVTAASGVVEELTAAQAKTVLALVKADVGLGDVDNTTDANKPVSTAQQTALDLKANIESPTFTGTVTVPNSSFALAKIANIATARILGRNTAASGVIEELTAATAKTVLALVKADVGLGSADNTADAAKSVLNATEWAGAVKTVSTGAPSGGADGDIHFQYTA